MTFVFNLTPQFKRPRPPKGGPTSVRDLRSSVKMGSRGGWRLLAGSVAAALVGAVAVTAFLRVGPSERERFHQAEIASPTTTGSIDARH